MSVASSAGAFEPLRRFHTARLFQVLGFAVAALANARIASSAAQTRTPGQSHGPLKAALA
jgi:hypothetical protein